jgi:hypothetical protein
MEPEDEEEEKEDDWEWLEQQGARQLHNYWPSEARERVSKRVQYGTIRATVSDSVVDGTGIRLMEPRRLSRSITFRKRPW